MSNELEKAALAYSEALMEINYSAWGNHQLHRSLRSCEGADQRALDSILQERAERFLELLEAETDPKQLKDLAFRNMNLLELQRVLVPILDKYVQLCGPDILLYLLIGNLYWNYGEDELAKEYFDRAVCLDSGSLYVLRQELFHARNMEDQVRFCRKILDLYPNDQVALETLERIERGIEPPLSPRAGEHSSIDFVLSRLTCNEPSKTPSSA